MTISGTAQNSPPSGGIVCHLIRKNAENTDFYSHFMVYLSHEKDKNNTTSNPEIVTISRGKYDESQSIKEQNAELSHMNDPLIEQIRLARQRRFDASSEQSTDDSMECLGFLFDEAEVYTAEPEAPVVAHIRKKKSGDVQRCYPKQSACGHGGTPPIRRGAVLPCHLWTTQYPLPCTTAPPSLSTPTTRRHSLAPKRHLIAVIYRL